MNEIEIMQELLGNIAAAATHLDEQIAVYNSKIRVARRLIGIASVILVIQAVLVMIMVLVSL